MKTVQEIRLRNFHLLLEEAGSQATLARLTKVPAPFVSQLKNDVPNKGGKPRSIGDDTARKLEAGMGKPEGWMDADHSKSMIFSELNALEAQVVTLFRKLNDDDRDEIIRFTNNKFSERFPGQTSAANPYANAPAPGKSPAPVGAGSYPKRITPVAPLPGAGKKKEKK